MSFGKKLVTLTSDDNYVKTHGQCMSLREKTEFPFFDFPIFRHLLTKVSRQHMYMKASIGDSRQVQQQNGGSNLFLMPRSGFHLWSGSRNLNCNFHEIYYSTSLAWDTRVG